jgi:hypothetical protein
MKSIIKISGFAILMIILVSSCMNDPIKEAQDNYDYNAIIPEVLNGVQGPSLAIQTFTADYTINYYRGGSQWNWSATNATVKSVSEDTRIATILFATYPSGGKATVNVTETTQGGVTSPAVSREVTVQKYCPLANGVANLAGSWAGTDGQGDYTYESVITTAVSGTQLAVTGIGKGFIEDFWGETVQSGGTCKMTVNVNGTLDIPRQYIFTTDYKGDAYDYEIKGSGTWDNCGSKPTLKISYDIYYPGDATGIAASYPSYFNGLTYLSAVLTLN